MALISVEVSWLPLLFSKISFYISLFPSALRLFLSPLVFDRYSKYSKVDVAKAIDLEMKGDIESCLTAVGKGTTLNPQPSTLNSKLIT